MTEFDLLVRGGQVVDPSQGLNGARDVAIAGDQIAAVEPEIDPARAAVVVDATGKLVTAGLIDLIAHSWARNPMGIAPDTLAANECTTTVVSPGDPGPGMVYAYRKQVVEPSQARAFAYVMCSWFGYSNWPSSEIYPDARCVDSDDIAGALIGDPDVLIGVKVRLSEDVIGTLDPLPLLQKTLDAAALAEAATGKTFRVVVHIGPMRSQSTLTQIVAMLRCGDMITHCFHGTPNVQGQPTGFAQSFAPIQAAYDAKAKGVILDVGWGGSPAGGPLIGGSCDYLTAVICMAPIGHVAPGIRPDTLSSDTHANPGGGGHMRLTEVMANMLALNTPSNVAYAGFAGLPPLNPAITLDDVVRAVTVTPAQVINRIPLLGTLQIGAPADVAILRSVAGPMTLNDTMGRGLAANLRILPVQAIARGELLPPSV